MTPEEIIRECVRVAGTLKPDDLIADRIALRVTHEEFIACLAYANRTRGPFIADLRLTDGPRGRKPRADPVSITCYGLKIVEGL